MHTNALNTIINNIKSVDTNTSNTDITPIYEYCVKKHNEAIDNLKEIYDFVEKNIDIFSTPKGGWKSTDRNHSYHRNYTIGYENVYNCVIRLQYDNDNKSLFTYWVDGGIIIRYNTELKKVIYMSDCDSTDVEDRDGKRTWNDYYDTLPFFNLKGNSYGQGGGVDWEGSKMTSGYAHNFDEFSIKTLKDNVDKNYAHIERVLEKLTYSLNKINESVMNRQKTLNDTFEGTDKNKVSKYVIEISKIED